MNAQKVFNRVDNLFQYVYYLAKLNILFIVYTLRGGIVLGIFPALCTMCHIILKNDISEVSSNMRHDFFARYKHYFKKSNATGYFLTLIGIVFYLNFIAMSSGIANYSLINVIPFTTLLLLFIIISVWIFPIFVQRSISIKTLFKYSLIIGIVNIHYTFISFFSIFIIVYLSLLYPSLLLFFTFSFSAFILLKITSKPVNQIK